MIRRIKEKRRCGYYWTIFGMTLLLLGFLAGPAGASLAFLTTVDENGHGYTNYQGIGVLPYVIAPDPGPGGLGAVLTYHLPFPVVPGDVLMTENPAYYTGLSDVVRFNSIGGVNTLVFYSDNVGGYDSLADIISPPSAYYPNNVTIPEVGPSDNYNWANWSPAYGQPGYVSTDIAMNYVFYSDIPLPPSALLLGSGLLGLLGWRRFRKS